MNAIGRRAELACRLGELRRLGEQATRNPMSTMAATAYRVIVSMPPNGCSFGAKIANVFMIAGANTTMNEKTRIATAPIST